MALCTVLWFCSLYLWAQSAGLESMRTRFSSSVTGCLVWTGRSFWRCWSSAAPCFCYSSYITTGSTSIRWDTINKNKQNHHLNMNKLLFNYQSHVYPENNQQVRQLRANSYFQWRLVGAIWCSCATIITLYGFVFLRWKTICNFVNIDSEYSLLYKCRPRFCNIYHCSTHIRIITFPNVFCLQPGPHILSQTGHLTASDVQWVSECSCQISDKSIIIMTLWHMQDRLITDMAPCLWLWC